MFYRKPLKVKKTSNVKFKIANFSSGINADVDENSLPFGSAKLSYNFKLSNGALKTGIGFKDLKLPNSLSSTAEHGLQFLTPVSEINKVWLYPFYNNTTKKKEDLLLISADNKLFYCQVVSPVSFIYEITNEVEFTSVPNAIYYNLGGEGVMLVTSVTDGTLVYHPQIVNEISTDAPKIISLCRHYEKIFAIEEGKRSKLVVSSNVNAADWEITFDQAKYLDLTDENGALVKVISFNDYVYVFKEYGIIKISAYGDQSEFSLSDMYVTSGKIYGNSVCICGDKILFLSKNGIYSFNGYKVEKLTLNIENLFTGVDNEDCCATYYNGKYYLGLKLNFNDDKQIGCESYSGGFVNNALIELDLKTGKIEIVRGVDLKSICAIEYKSISKLVAAFNGQYKNKLAEMTTEGNLFNTPLKKSWLTPFTNLGYPNKRKKIRRINLISKLPCKLKISTEKEVKEFEVEGSNRTTSVLPNIDGEMFSFELESEESEAYIANGEIEVSISE